MRGREGVEAHSHIHRYTPGSTREGRREVEAHSYTHTHTFIEVETQEGRRRKVEAHSYRRGREDVGDHSCT